MEEINLFAKKKWLDCIIIVVGTILISFLAYLFINGRMGSPELELYQPGQPSSVINEAANKGRAFVNNLDLTWVTIIGWFIFIGMIIAVIVLVSLKKMSWKIAILLAISAGILVRLIYANVTDNIFTRQNDVWTSTQTGHYGITMYIFRNWKVPELVNGSLDSSYQMYHPKMVHFIHAIVMKINSYVFKGANDWWTLYQSIRIYSAILSIGIVFITYFSLKEIFNKPLPVLIGTLFVAGSPLLIRMSAGSNNDGQLYFFIWLSIYFTIKLYKAKSWKKCIIPLIGIAVSVGMAMGSKLSGALIAIPVGTLMVYKYGKMILDSEKPERLKIALIMLGLYVGFMVICAPIGLYWPYYNMVHYNQPLTYVWHNLNKGLLVPENYSYFERYMFFSFKTYFNSIFEQLWASSAYNGIVDYNIYSAVAKSFIFGEFSYSGATVIFCAMLYAANIILILGSVFVGGYIIISKVLKKEYDIPVMLLLPILIYFDVVLFSKTGDVDFIVFGIVNSTLILFLAYYFIKHWRTIRERKALLFFSIIFLTFALSYFTFQIEYPYTCTQDSRYVAVLFFVGAFVFGTLFDKCENRKPLLIALSSVIGFYIFSSIGLYLTV